MSPKTRNTLMIGGALILIALLLVCGPLEGRFGGGGKDVEETPAVTAGPPIDAVETTDAENALSGAAAGATTGAAIGGAAAVAAAADAAGSSGAGSSGLPMDASTDETRVAAGAGSTSGGSGAALAAGGAGLAAGGAAAAASALAASGGSGGSGASTANLPPVSTGVPTTNVAGAGLAAGATAAAVASVAAFDDVFDSGSGKQPGPAGAAVDRFAPPVAANGAGQLALLAMADSIGLTASNLRQACDTPGSGCNNLSGLSGGGGVTSPPNRGVAPGVRPRPPAPIGPPNRGVAPGVRPRPPVAPVP